jgi:phosphoglycolate phosphatase
VTAAGTTDCLRGILVDSATLLLDFDGPICSVFAGLPAPLVADQLRVVLADGGHTTLPEHVARTDDPFEVFAYAATLGPDEARYVEAAMRAHELDAMTTAEPTPGGHDLIHAWHATGRPLAIVSNNSAAAVEAYTHLHGLTDCVRLVSARTTANPALLKPNPHLLLAALAGMPAPASSAAFIGDTTTDIRAAHAARTAVIGYANKPGKAARFTEARADAIVTSMTVLADLARTL